MPDPAELPDLRWTKLNRPRIAGDVVRRARARERLERSLDGPLTLVCAPAGYGKTTLLSDWLSNKEIARELSISPMTVKPHTVNIYQKLLVSGRREAVAKAEALGLLSPTSRG